MLSYRVGHSGHATGVIPPDRQFVCLMVVSDYYFGYDADNKSNKRMLLGCS
jgi:hypothetical protein